ncbi:MAG: gliding motility-associated C-terminal domain-containing protein [Bacteroidales bacterium]|jgi:gliding motility-associated-like protein|nr:gliding motility-associated C-terminal domain-containing protein [Bacteroidales bacterium]
MKTLLFLAVMLLAIHAAIANIIIYPQTSISLNGNLHISIRNMDLSITTSTKVDSTVTIALYSKADKHFEIIGDTLYFGNLKIGGNYSLNAYSKFVSITGNITMMENGVLNVTDNDVLLNGSIKDESNNCYITGSTGKIIKRIALQQEAIETGIGLSFSVFDRHSTNIEVQRFFEPSIRKDKEGVKRLYKFSEPLTLGNLDFRYLLRELNGIEDPVLCVYTQEKGIWDMIFSRHNNSRQTISGKSISKTENVEQVSIFSYPELSFPLYFTPNGDGINDFYVIEGIEKYENTVFTVLDNTGKQIFRACPYMNNFTGSNLKDGTYYFVFKRSVNDNTPYKRGTFEIIR